MLCSGDRTRPSSSSRSTTVCMGSASLRFLRGPRYRARTEREPPTAEPLHDFVQLFSRASSRWSSAGTATAGTRGLIDVDAALRQTAPHTHQAEYRYGTTDMSAPTSGSAGGSPTPGFYPDPSIPGYIRYWNGAAWVPGTSRPAPAEGEAMPAPPPGAAASPSPELSAPLEQGDPHPPSRRPARSSSTRRRRPAAPRCPPYASAVRSPPGP
ncbi:DUF2510 domain-containing protein [Streptomyces nigrescens]